MGFKNMGLGSPKFEFIYFIQSNRGGPIKIGHCINMESRLKTLQTAHPYTLKVIAFFKTKDNEAERKMHYRFRHLHLRGEWYRPEKSLLEFIDNIHGTNYPPTIQSCKHCDGTGLKIPAYKPKKGRKA